MAVVPGTATFIDAIASCRRAAGPAEANSVLAGPALFVDRRKGIVNVYSPKIPDRFIPILYRLGRERGRPMTQLVAEAVERYLVEEGCLGADLAASAQAGRRAA